MRTFHLTTALSQEDFRRLWSAEHERIFAEKALPDNPFKDAGWRVVCICGPAAYVNEQHGHVADLSDPHQRIFAALVNAIRATGDIELAGCLFEAPHLNDSFFASTQITPATLLEMRRRALDAFDVQIFGRSCRWGVNVSADEELSVVGGDAAFMEQFIAEAGGDRALRDAFAHCADYLLRFPRGAEFIGQLRGLAGWLRGPS